MISRIRTTRFLSTLALGGALLLISSSIRTVPAVASPKPESTADKPFPAQNFTLTDIDGVKHSLADYRGRTVALFFFCGCQWCHEVAGQWSTMQRAGALPKTGTAKDPITLIVFSADADGAKQFAHETALDMSSTVMLTDEDLAVTMSKAYNAEPCPRVFVIDPGGNVVYTNDHKDDAARVAPASIIASRALGAVVNAANQPAKSSAG